LYSNRRPDGDGPGTTEPDSGLIGKVIPHDASLRLMTATRSIAHLFDAATAAGAVIAALPRTGYRGDIVSPDRACKTARASLDAISRDKSTTDGGAILMANNARAARPLARLWAEWKTLLIFLLVMFVFRSAFADWYQVPTPSMNPTIAPGDRVVVNKLAYDLKFPFTTRHMARWGEPMPCQARSSRSTRPWTSDA
jgi:hypothetical protein